jgi:hypothetical protein
LNDPTGVVADPAGNLYIADAGDNRIREVQTNGVIITVAGTGKQGYSGHGGSATNALLYHPSGVGLDSTGNLFVADSFNNVVRKLALAGLPTLALDNVSPADAGTYQVMVTGPYGSVTSAVASLTVVLPPTNSVIVMESPVVAATSLVLGFKVTQGTASSFTLLQSAGIGGPWTTNLSAVLTTNSQTGAYRFTLPLPESTAFYRLRSP